jgi:predicted membrane protein
VYRPSATRLGIFNTQVISNADSNVDGHAGLSVFGTVVADLSRRPLPYGETRISVSSVFGSIIVRVPEDVGVKVSGLSLFSTVKVRGLRIGDGFVEAQEYETPGYAQMGRRLRIDATVIFGTLKVKR